MILAILYQWRSKTPAVSVVRDARPLRWYEVPGCWAQIHPDMPTTSRLWRPSAPGVPEQTDRESRRCAFWPGYWCGTLDSDNAARYRRVRGAGICQGTVGRASVAGHANVAVWQEEVGFLNIWIQSVVFSYFCKFSIFRFVIIAVEGSQQTESIFYTDHHTKWVIGCVTQMVSLHYMWFSLSCLESWSFVSSYRMLIRLCTFPNIY